MAQGLIVWPRRPNGWRRRASATRALSKGRLARPAGWLMRLLMLALIAVPSLIITSPGYVAFADRLPDPSQVTQPPPEDTILYAADGVTVLADLHPPGYQHYYEPVSAMGDLLPEAVISIEDHNFYQEPGVDPQGVLRAGVIDWRAHTNVEGASTITQQLVKMRLVGNEPTLDRKIREAVLAIEIERQYTKAQILEMYLNDVFFGNTAWGTAAAASIYFHKPTKDLDLAQAAMLAGIIRGPTLYDPLIDWTAAKNRQHEVLSAMLRDGKITAVDAAKAFAEDISPPRHMFGPNNQVIAADFIRYTTDQLVKQFGSYMTFSGGLRVVTTINLKLQKLAQDAVTGNIARMWWRNVQQGALVAIDPTSGAIVAMVGSAFPNAHGGQYNLAVWPPRNPGSSMKIFTYTAAIASGKYSMTTPIADAPFAYEAPGSTEVYRPRNYDGRYHGTLPVEECMGNSLNIPAVKVELGIGVGAVVEMARLMGAPPYQQHSSAAGPIYTTNDPLNSYGPSLTLGGYGETPLQMATGASVLAAKGILRPPFVIQQVTQDGKKLYTHVANAGARRVLDPRVAYILQQIMSNDNNRALIFGRGSLLTLAGHRVAVKTGTSDSFADAWTIGFTPHLVAAVWGGNPDWRQKMTLDSDSFYVAAPIWHQFMATALPALHRGNEWYPEPPGLINGWAYGSPVYYLPGTH
jgi:membrane peptidoglycan carboxypeptidase